jgi:cytochrome c551/c552
MGDKRVSEINFGNSKTPRTLPDYLFEKIRDPQAFATPTNLLKMPKYDLPDEDLRDIVLALLSFNADRVAAEKYRFPKVESIKYEPKGEFGRMVDKFRCFSCHSFKGRGRNISYDLTSEGSRVRREWLFNYFKLPYTIRPTLTIRMPIFNMTDEEARILTTGFMHEMVDSEIEKNLESQLTDDMAEQGKKLLEEKGSLACHQVGKKGGYVGPSFTQGAFAGEKLRAGWIFKWLKNPQAIKPDVLEPNYGFSDEEALALTAYLMSIKRPDQSGSKNGKNN